MTYRNLLLFYLFYATSAGKAPIQWGQTKDSLTIRISKSVCSPTTAVEAAVTGVRSAGDPSTFTFTCGKLSLKAKLRDSVKAENPLSCKKSRKGHTCVLGKLPGYSAYAWDRLFRASGGPPSTWPVKTGVDFSGMMEPIDLHKPTYPASLEMDDGAIKDVFQNSNAVAVVLDVTYPWCSEQCKEYETHLVKASKLLTDSDGISFGFFNAQEDIVLAAKAKQPCSDKCTLAVFRKDNSIGSLRIKAPSDRVKPEDIVTQMREKSEPLVIPLTNAGEADALKNKGDALVLGYADSTDEVFLAKFTSAAESVREKDGLLTKVQFAYVPSEGGEAALNGKLESYPPTFPSSVEPMVFFPGKDGGQAALVHWAFATTIPLVANGQYEDPAFRNSLELPTVQIIVESVANVSTAFEEIAAQFRGKLSFVVRERQYRDPGDFGVRFGDTTLPAVVVESVFGQASNPQSTKWSFPTTGSALLTKFPGRADLVSWLATVAKGDAKPYLKSGVPPADPWTKGSLHTVVANTVKDERRAARDTLLILGQSYQLNDGATGDCKKVAGLASTLATAFENVAAFRVGKMHTDENDSSALGKRITTKKRPCAIVLLRGDDKASGVVRYKGKYKQGDLLRWLKKKSRRAKKGWAAMKARLKALKQERAAAKAALEKAAEERKAMLASTVGVDVTDAKDGGILKQTYEAAPAGAGSPSPGQTITAHYTGTLLDGTKFDSSRDRGDPFEFTLGQGQVIGCWDKAFATMKFGDKAVLTCTHPYAYGERGSPPSIPPEATLQFDVELIDTTTKKEL